MKSLLFLFFIAEESSRLRTPKEDSFKYGVKVMVMCWGMFALMILLSGLHALGIWQWLMANWPYEYGRIHSKNFFAPTGVAAILDVIIVWLSFKKYFSQEHVKSEIKDKFNTYFGREKAKKLEWVVVFFYFFNAFSGVMFAFQIWWLFVFWVAVIIASEIWVRNEYYIS